MYCPNFPNLMCTIFPQSAQSSVSHEEEVDNFIRVLEKKVEEGGQKNKEGLEEENVDNLVPRRVTQRSAASTREEIRYLDISI